MFNLLEAQDTYMCYSFVPVFSVTYREFHNICYTFSAVNLDQTTIKSTPCIYHMKE